MQQVWVLRDFARAPAAPEALELRRTPESLQKPPESPGEPQLAGCRGTYSNPLRVAEVVPHPSLAVRGPIGGQLAATIQAFPWPKVPDSGPPGQDVGGSGPGLGGANSNALLSVTEGPRENQNLSFGRFWQVFGQTRAGDPSQRAGF